MNLKYECLENICFLINESEMRCCVYSNMRRFGIYVKCFCKRVYDRECFRRRFNV